MDRDLRLLVMRQLDAVHLAYSGGAPPFGDAAGLRRVEIDDVDRTRRDQPAHAVARNLALPGIDRDRRAAAHLGHAGRVVMPMTRLLEPTDVVRFDEPCEFDRLGDRPAAIGIDRDDEIGSAAIPAGRDPPGIGVRGETPALALAAPHPRAL